MEIYSSEYFGLACVTLLVIGIVLAVKKDRPNQSRKTTRMIGIILIIVGAVVFIVWRGRNYGRIGPRQSCFGSGAGDPNCIIPYKSMTFFEILIAEIGLEVLAQSIAKNRYRGLKR
jgi:hypothetical protein